MIKQTDWDPYDEQDHAGFWVHPDECLDCGCCIAEIPEVFAWRKAFAKDRPATAVRQPVTQEEVHMTIRAMSNCMAESIYYAGKNESILQQIRKFNDVCPVCVVHG